MKRRWFAATIPILMMVPVAAGIDTAAMSRIGRDFFADQRPGNISRSQHFTIYAANAADGLRIANEADYAYAFIKRILPGEASVSSPVWIVMVDDAAAWQAMTRRHGLREDGLALQIDRELYFKDDDELKRRPDRIAHEIIHFRLRELYGTKVPLWLEEGLAGHYGWICAVEYYGRRGVELERQQLPASERDLVSLEDLLKRSRYPRDADAMRAFYRQSEALVRVLGERLGRNGIAPFVAALSSPVKGESPVAVFRRASAIDHDGELAMIAAMRNYFLSHED